jgi:Domain of unknown function (DUF4326)
MSANALGMSQIPIRIQRKRTKGHKTPTATIYVGRPTKFGNPFRLTKDGFIQCYSTNRNILDKWILWSYNGGFETKDIVELYERWLKGELKKVAPYLPTPPSFEVLKGKNLSCFCSLNSPCHVDILLKIANE